MRGGTLVGVGILLIALLGLAVWQVGLSGGQSPAPSLPSSNGPQNIATVPQDALLTAITGKVGGEKTGFCKDAEMLQILETKYKLKINVSKSGSIAMLRGDTAGLDFLWPGSRSNVEMFHGKSLRVEDIFNTPIVVYSRAPVVDALMQPIALSDAPGAPKEPIVEKEGDTYYVRDFARLVALTEAKVPWSRLGLARLTGSVKIFSTDPSESNSGNAFAGLLANTLGGGEVVQGAEIDPILPRMKAIFGRMGRLETSSSTLFDAYLGQGMGAFPLIIGYESQLVELTFERPADFEAIKREVRILYPRPTTWSSHPIICLTEGGTRFAEALKDPQIQKIAWERHGFRVGLATESTPSATLREIGFAPTIDAVLQMPANDVMTKILESLSGR